LFFRSIRTAIAVNVRKEIARGSSPVYEYFNKELILNISKIKVEYLNKISGKIKIEIDIGR
tara:strand:+ start:543 stop:725 length:183 start_codon:yes stop_codon:yes gene_type:complete